VSLEEMGRRFMAQRHLDEPYRPEDFVARLIQMMRDAEHAGDVWLAQGLGDVLYRYNLRAAAPPSGGQEET
jgi:hypothetical protein